MEKFYEIYYSATQYYDEIDITTEDLRNHKDYLYFRCPVWNHLFHRTFILKSPIDFELKLNSKTIQYKINNGEVVTTNFTSNNYERNTIQNNVFTAYIPDLEQKNPIIQVTFADVFLWTPSELKYVWFEFGDHPMTSIKNNFVSLSGWFNLANHSRNTSLGIRFVDKDKPVIIKKGDPLYRLKFYTDDLNSLPILVKKDISSFPENEMSKNVSMIRNNPEILKSLLFEKL